MTHDLLVLGRVTAMTYMSLECTGIQYLGAGTGIHFGVLGIVFDAPSARRMFLSSLRVSGRPQTRYKATVISRCCSSCGEVLCQATGQCYRCAGGTVVPCGVHCVLSSCGYFTLIIHSRQKGHGFGAGISNRSQFFVFRALRIHGTTFSTAWARRARWWRSQLGSGLLGCQTAAFRQSLVPRP